MERLKQRVPLWSPSANSLAARVQRASGGAVRVLGDQDTEALTSLMNRDPVVNVSVLALARHRGSVAPARGRGASVILGIDASDAGDNGGAQLSSACWVGSNIIPIGASAYAAQLYGHAVGALRRRVSSMYGQAEAVLALHGATGYRNIREVRPNQPLMSMSRPSSVEPLAGVRKSQLKECAVVEEISAAMFSEELGFSPYTHGVSEYRQRIWNLVEAGHSLIARDERTGVITFKAEFGALTPQAVQVQGVWVNPDYRGQGLAAPGMAAVVKHGLTLAPVVSLYVNNFNTPALRTYERVGFTQIGTFATVLF